MTRPFVRYVGGKSWLISKLVPEIMAGKPELYVEPFLGGGAIALALPPELPKILGDTNAALVDVWRCLQRVPALLHDKLAELEAREASSFWNKQGPLYYKQVRDEFNAMVTSPREMWPDRAARFLFLNARCFNGLWRTNRAGLFNVPFARLERPRAYGLEELKSYAPVLARATIASGHFLACGGPEVTRRARLVRKTADVFEAMGTCLAGVTAFFDPPYDAMFGDYGPNGFGEKDQRQLASHFGSWAAMGARVYTTNSDTPLIRELYSIFRIEETDEMHSVGAKGDSRLKKRCLLIRGGPC